MTVDVSVRASECGPVLVHVRVYDCVLAHVPMYANIHVLQARTYLRVVVTWSHMHAVRVYVIYVVRVCTHALYVCMVCICVCIACMCVYVCMFICTHTRAVYAVTFARDIRDFKYGVSSLSLFTSFPGV